MTRLPAVYLIGAGPLGIRTPQWARAEGLATLMTDQRADAPGFAHADERARIDGSDVEAHLAHARALSRRYDIRGVWCNAEFGARVVARLARELDLAHHAPEAVEGALDKLRMKRALAAAGVPTPQPIELGCDARADRPATLLALRAALEREGRLVIKPAGGSGSRGVRVIDAASDLERDLAAALDPASGGGELVVEPYLDGRSIDANGLFLDGRFHAAGVLEKFITPPPDCLPIGGYDPAQVGEDVRREVYVLLERSARALDLTAGPVKSDCLLTDRGLVVLEVSPRLHGDVTTCNTLPFGSGINPVRAWLCWCATGALDARLLAARKMGCATWRVLPSADWDPPAALPKGAELTCLWRNPCASRPHPDGARDTRGIAGYVCAAGIGPAALQG
jgi:biotin carboxylase